MGCDIHIHTEILNPKTKVWKSCDIHVPNKEGDLFRSEWYRGRYYELFMLLARGVRGDVPWGRECQGFPEDASSVAIDEYKEWNGDAHSESWITLHDLIIYTTEIQMNNKSSQGGKDSLAGFVNDWISFMDRYNDWTKWWVVEGESRYTPNTTWQEYTRIVYWFDN